MVLYLGNNKAKVKLNNNTYHINIFIKNVVVEKVKLISSDNYVLKDLNGLYLTIKKEV